MGRASGGGVGVAAGVMVLGLPALNDVGLLLDASHTGFDQRVVIRVLTRSMVDDKAVEQFNRATGLGIAPADTGRCLVTQGIRLNDLAGRTFRIGDALIEEGLISTDQLGQAITAQKQSGRMLGEVLVDEGIITAEEIAQLDLSGCYLATLSACETSLPEKSAGSRSKPSKPASAKARPCRPASPTH